VSGGRRPTAPVTGAARGVGRACPVAFRVPVGDDAVMPGAMRRAAADDCAFHDELVGLLGIDWTERAGL
jgi:hypothetical protein